MAYLSKPVKIPEIPGKITLPYLSNHLIIFIFHAFFFPEYGCSRSGRLNFADPVSTVDGCVNSLNPQMP